MKNIILLLALFPLFLSCTDDDKEEVKHDYFTDFVTGVTVGGICVLLAFGLITK